MSPETKPVEYVDVLFLGAIVVFILVDTGAFLWLLTMDKTKVNDAVLPIFSSFVTASVIAPLGVWCGFRYGSSQGSKNKDDTINAVAAKAAE